MTLPSAFATTLVTGFEPFDGDPLNPSWLIAQALQGRRVHGTRVQAVQLPCTFAGAIPALPWSGTGESGYGVTNSSHTLDVLTRPRAVVVDARRAAQEMWWHPYTPGLEAVGRSLATLRGGAGPGAKAKALTGLLRGFATRWKA